MKDTEEKNSSDFLNTTSKAFSSTDSWTNTSLIETRWTFSSNHTKVPSVATPKTLQSGYDLDVYGVQTGWFYLIHVPALVCIFTSLISASTVIIASFRSQTRSFRFWTRSERFVVYLSLCDALFNVSHSMDHLQMVITKQHVYPPQLCEFYSFFIGEFVSAQLLMTNIAAINAFALIFYQRQIPLGRYDWRLLLYTFGVPFVLSICATLLGYYGPSGSYCYFDGVKGALASIFLTTVPMTLILVVNIILYTLTWWRINTESKKIKNMLGNEAQTQKASHSAARLLSLFVTVFFIQWWALALFGIWQYIEEVPQEFFTVVVMFSNLGGVFNGVVFIIIKKRKRKNKSKDGQKGDHDSATRSSSLPISVIDTKI